MYRSILLCLMLLFLFCSGNSNSRGTDRDDDNKILATVGSHNISLSEFSSRYMDYLIGAGINDNNLIRESILNNMINEVVLFNYDDNKNIFDNSEYQRELEASKKETILSYLKDQEVYKYITASDEEIREAFLRANQMIAARHLYAKTKDEADELYELLKSGVSFDILAKQVFTDSVLKNNGGYIGYFTWGDMDPAFEDAAFSLKIGEISKPVKTVYGYSIIKVEDRVSRPLLTENEYLNKKDHLAQVVRMRKMKPYERAYIKSIIDLDKIKINDESLSNIIDDLNLSKPVEMNNSKITPVECASYMDKKYFIADIENEINELPLYQKNRIYNSDDVKAVIKGLILRDSLYSIALKEGFDTVKVVRDTYQKLCLDLFMRFKAVEVMKATQVPDSVVYNYYKENINSFMSSKKINLQELIVDNKKLADSLKMQGEKIGDFSKLIRQYSLKKNDGNDADGFSDLDNYGELKDTLWNLITGKISGPFRIENYYILFKVIGKKDGQPLEFNLIKDRVAMLVKKQMHQSLLENYANNLKKSVRIKINYDILWDYKISGLSNKNKLN